MHRQSPTLRNAHGPGFALGAPREVAWGGHACVEEPCSASRGRRRALEHTRPLRRAEPEPRDSLLRSPLDARCVPEDRLRAFPDPWGGAGGGAAGGGMTNCRSDGSPNQNPTPDHGPFTHRAICRRKCRCRRRRRASPHCADPPGPGRRSPPPALPARRRGRDELARIAERVVYLTVQSQRALRTQARCTLIPELLEEPRRLCEIGFALCRLRNQCRQLLFRLQRARMNRAQLRRVSGAPCTAAAPP